MTSLALGSFETDLEGALALGGRALAWTESSQLPLLVSASLTARALVLGALQREDTLRGRSPARFDAQLARRRSTGTEAQLDGAVLYHALALPRVDALFGDASARTLLNRNLRLLLRGYTKAGVPLRYFGTEVLALLGHPVALVGYDQAASGATLLEVLIGLENPCVVRPALRRDPPAALFTLLRRSPPAHELLLSAVGGVRETLGATVELAETLPPAPPAPELLVSGPPATVAIPLGVVEAVLEPAPRITGDLLVGTSALQRFEHAASLALADGQALSAELLPHLAAAPLDGARPPDLLQALQLARPTR